MSQGRKLSCFCSVPRRVLSCRNVYPRFKTVLKDGALVRVKVGEVDLAKEITSYRDSQLIYKRISFEGPNALVTSSVASLVSEGEAGAAYYDAHGLPSDPAALHMAAVNLKARNEALRDSLKSRFGDKDFGSMTLDELSALFKSTAPKKEEGGSDNG